MKRILINEFIICFAFSETLNFKDAVTKISKSIHVYLTNICDMSGVEFLI